TKSQRDFVIYVDGTAASTFTATSDLVHVGTQQVRIGNRESDNSFFDGMIDEVRLWSIARSAADIQCDRSRRIEPDHPDYAALTALWRFDEASGTTATDQKLLHDGTLVNSPSRVPSGAF